MHHSLKKQRQKANSLADAFDIILRGLWSCWFEYVHFAVWAQTSEHKSKVIPILCHLHTVVIVVILLGSNICSSLRWCDLWCLISWALLYFIYSAISKRYHLLEDLLTPIMKYPYLTSSFTYKKKLYLLLSFYIYTAKRTQCPCHWVVPLYAKNMKEQFRGTCLLPGNYLMYQRHCLCYGDHLQLHRVSQE